jgi:ribosomal protein S18 acetylase RimI-like enzyme
VDTDLGTIVIRTARPDDEPALAAIDRLTWSTATTPAPAPDPPRPFFQAGRRESADVVVAERDGVVAGYAGLVNRPAVPSHAHVWEIDGLAVHPDAGARGVGRALVEAAVAEAVRRGARKVTLRVLGHNGRARRLYTRCGFVVEGVLRDEFVLDGGPVDDVLMARHLAPVPS